MAAVDFLVAVDSYPNPDDKIRSTSFQVIDNCVWLILSLLFLVEISKIFLFCFLSLGSRRWQCRECFDLCSSIRPISENYIEGLRLWGLINITWQLKFLIVFLFDYSSIIRPHLWIILGVLLCSSIKVRHNFIPREV